MRRRDREVEDIKKIEEIVSSARFMHLGLFDGDYPYVVPLPYGYKLNEEKFIFYMHSAKEGHKLDCINKNENVFVEIDKDENIITANTACGHGAEYECVMCRGKASIVEDIEEKIEALEVLMKVQTDKEFKVTEEMTKSVVVIKVLAEDISAKVRVR